MAEERAGWHRGDTLAADQFRASGPADVLFDKRGFTVGHVVARAKMLLAIRLAAWP